MAEITAAMVKELRESTGAGMMACKQALAEADGDMQAAVDLLRTKGLAALAKKSGRATNEGAIAAFVSDDSRVGVLVEVNSETDFVARNAEFLGFVNGLAEHIAVAVPDDADQLMGQTFSGRAHTVEQVLGEAVTKLGENMCVTRFIRAETGGTGAVASYIHGGGRIGVLVEFGFGNEGTASSEAFKTAAKDVAMQVAAAFPQYVSREAVPADVLERELAIYKAQAAESGKPEAIQEKMAAGRLEKFYKEVILPEQVFVKDPDSTVAKYLAGVSKELDDKITITGFTRWALGEITA
ncbi:MAG: translation elongation factor Ts [Coriobacteriia bacterium]|nr:translation elongation factor Ts [Coriobacteriia bacterium]